MFIPQLDERLRMLYQLLVTARESGSKGRICHYQEKAKASWGKKECPPNFAFIDFEGTEEEVKHLFSNCKHNFDTKKFIETEYNEEFEKESILKEKDFVHTVENTAIAKELNAGVEVVDGCGFMNEFQQVGDEFEQRKFMLKAFYSMRKLEGVKDCLLAFKYGTYADVRKTLDALPVESKKLVAKKMDNTVLKAMQKKWKILPEKEISPAVTKVKVNNGNDTFYKS